MRRIAVALVFTTCLLAACNERASITSSELQAKTQVVADKLSHVATIEACLARDGGDLTKTMRDAADACEAIAKAQTAFANDATNFVPEKKVEVAKRMEKLAKWANMHINGLRISPAEGDDLPKAAEQRATLLQAYIEIRDAIDDVSETLLL